MVYAKRRLFSFFYRWELTVENIKWQILIIMIIMILLVIIITLICEYYDKIFRCHHTSQHDHHKKRKGTTSDSMLSSKKIKNSTIKSYKFEHQLGSTIVLPPCFSRLSSTTDDITTILFKSDSGELLIINGKLISNNPRLMIKNHDSSELIIKSLELLDEGQYECRTDQKINYIVHLIVINSSTIHLTVHEGSNVTLQCTEQGMWIIEESHRGGPVRTQYTTELVLNNIQRNDHRFRTIICSTHNGHEKREYIIDIIYKPTVKLMISTRETLMCIICAHPLPHRIQWWSNIRKERDDNIHQININQSCIAQQFTFILKEELNIEQIIVCEAENIYGINRDSLKVKAALATNNLTYTTQKSLITLPNKLIATTTSVKNESSCCYRSFQLLLTILFLVFYSILADIGTLI